MAEAPVRHSDLLVNERFFDLYDRMVGNISIPDVLRDLTAVVCEEFRAERSTIYLIDKETNELQSVAVVGNVARTIRVPIRATSLAGFCAQSGRSFIIPNAYGDLTGIDSRLRFDRRWDNLNDFRTRDVMCAPARFKAEVMGVVQVINSGSGTFSSADLEALESISRMVGYALYHARLYDDLATMKKLEEEKAEFMRIMVHELKSPAAAAKMMADLLKGQDYDNPKIADLPPRISNSMDHLLKLAGELLILAKVKSGGPLGEIVVLDAVEEARRVCEPYQAEATTKGLLLSTAFPNAPLKIRFDSQGFHLVLSNLVSNAIKYTPAGNVEVNIQAEHGWLRIDVKDSGIGIPQQDIPKLFREFFRASNAKQMKIQGSGVGLSGVKRIVERFGGEMTLTTSEGSGSTFTVRIPLAK